MGLKAPRYFSMAYTPKQWKKGQKCIQCGTPMEFRYEVKGD